MFYDGSHSERDQYDGIILPQPSLTEEYVLIVDDWNWDLVRRGTLNALRDTKSTIVTSIEIRTTFDNSLTQYPGAKSDWHNGLYIAGIRKEKIEAEKKPNQTPDSALSA